MPLRSFFPDPGLVFDLASASSAPISCPRPSDDRSPSFVFSCTPEFLVPDCDRFEARLAIDNAIEDRPKENMDTASDTPERRPLSAPVKKCGGGDSAKKPSGAGTVSYSIASQANLNRHIRTTHLRVSMCNICSITFTSQGNLNRHIRTTHLRVRVVCDVTGCEQTYSQISDLRRHKSRVHPALMDATA